MPWKGKLIVIPSEGKEAVSWKKKLKIIKYFLKKAVITK
jgi:hypothetical protein